MPAVFVLAACARSTPTTAPAPLTAAYDAARVVIENGRIVVYDPASMMSLGSQRADGCVIAPFWTKLKVSK